MSTIRVHPARPEPASTVDPPRADEHAQQARDGAALKRESKLTFGGLIYIGVTVFLAIGAVNSQNNLLFWLFGVAIATIIVSGLFSGNALMKIRLRARVLHEVHAGQELTLHYSVGNRSRFFPLFASLVTEEDEAGGRRRGLVPASVIHVAPGGLTRAMGSYTPELRGRVIFRRIRLSTRFPFGLLQKSLIFEHPRPLLVLPHELRLRSGLISRARAQGEHALRKSVRGGTSGEFWGLREYRAGDPRRRISWKHSARRAELVVVEHAESFSLRVWVVIVEPASLATPEDRMHAERAIAIAAGLLEQAGRESTPVGLWYPQRAIRQDPQSGRAASGRAVRSLALLDLAEPAHPLAPVPVRSRDRVVLIQRGSRVPAGFSGFKLIDTERPGAWLADPASLPPGLGGEA